ncbi:hypothetical protein JQS43_21920 [Natronosporangium hydrolyticum]|uniref:Uncharacterized protein n=1 Tax=Natronosporangium hydrolyticum TaxID=2811111 RepID=A0A895Y8T4_9ACTN|nr:hypothetical protein [Natronosporangium hydrolyticum]QSB14154.1 hypothetical protein JQS43_21920 [Natronosporangium hydrolyticum]
MPSPGGSVPALKTTGPAALGGVMERRGHQVAALVRLARHSGQGAVERSLAGRDAEMLAALLSDAVAMMAGQPREWDEEDLLESQRQFERGDGVVEAQVALCRRRLADGSGPAELVAHMTRTYSLWEEHGAQLAARAVLALSVSERGRP